MQPTSTVWDGIELAGIWDGLFFRIAKHWIAGETYEEALARVSKSNSNKVLGIINLVGEEVTEREEIAAATNEYLEILKAIDARKVQSCISVKPTQLGMGLDSKLYKENMNLILTTAKSLGNFVWIDMEGSPYTAETVDSYLEFRRKFDNVGVAVQAYMKRSEEDANRIVDAKGMIRLCKGAYNESPEIVFKRKDEINRNYSNLMRILFERGYGFAIATHDNKLIDETIGLSKTHPTTFEFEMLMGIRDKLKLQLVADGYRVSEYVPYGKAWKAYSMRRITEHRSNILLAARALVSD
jgi:proline dehydrogenase